MSAFPLHLLIVWPYRLRVLGCLVVYEYIESEGSGSESRHLSQNELWWSGSNYSTFVIVVVIFQVSFSVFGVWVENSRYYTIK